MEIKNYYQTSVALLPQGKAWTVSGELAAIIKANSSALSNADLVANQLINERIPNNAKYLIDEWEEFSGLPECVVLTDLEARRLALHRKLTQNRSFCYEALLELLDEFKCNAKITVIHPHHCLRDVNYRLWKQESWWQVIIEVKKRVPEMECYINKYKPVHMTIIFKYTESNDV